MISRRMWEKIKRTFWVDWTDELLDVPPPRIIKSSIRTPESKAFKGVMGRR